MHIHKVGNLHCQHFIDASIGIVASLPASQYQYLPQCFVGSVANLGIPMSLPALA